MFVYKLQWNASIHNQFIKNNKQNQNYEIRELILTEIIWKGFEYIFLSQIFVVVLALVACVAGKPTLFTYSSSSSPHVVDSVVDEPFHHHSSSYLAPYTYDGHDVIHSADYAYDSHHHGDYYGFGPEIYVN